MADSEVPNQSQWKASENSQVVYKRVTDSPVDSQMTSRPDNEVAGAWSPAITPLVIGFILLLGLISILGIHSMRQMDEVGRAIYEMQRSHAARLSMLLQLKFGVTQLNNEARARHASESRGELKPPFDFRLRRARGDVTNSIRELERSAVLAEHPTWRKFRTDLQNFVATTEDLRRYAVEGTRAFENIDRQLDQLLTTAGSEQQDIIDRSEAIERRAKDSITFWSFIALIVGALVAAGTIWEAQRRFKQMRRSMFEARRERTFTTQLLEGMVSAVAAIDENDRLRSANSAFFTIFPELSIGASIHGTAASVDATRMLQAATATRADQAVYRGRWVCRVGREQAEKSFDLYSSPLDLDGEKGQIMTLVDVTEAAESERDLRRTESLAAVGQATAQVAHEIRNPLGSIRLGVSMLRDSMAADPEALNTIELVERGIKHLNKLVVDVTQFSRRKSLERSEVDLHDLLDLSLDLVAERINSKKTPVEKKFSGEELKGHWDADQLRQVVVNLIANAVDASPEETPITIATEPISLEVHGNGDNAARQRFARVIIADQGRGMDKHTLDHIFEPFFSTKKRGTGLGLAIVKQIVEQHEGRIGVASEPGKGARFTIDLPL